MAVTTTKLRADAPPYLSPPKPLNHLQLSPPPHLALPFPIVLATYPYCAPPFLVAACAPQPAVYGFIQPGRLLSKQPVNLPFLSSPPPPPLSSKAVPSPASTAQASSPKALSSPSPPTSPPVQASRSKALPLPVGSPPHKLISPAGAGAEDEKQLQPQTAAPASAKPKGRRRRQVVGPGISRAPAPARSPAPEFTTRPRRPVPAPLWRDRQLTTVMIRNIPNKLTPGDLMLLLDDHCARANKKNKERGAAAAAYDFLYLRMDLSQNSSNMGYAFVNLTTKEAALGLHYALHGARWKVNASKKVVHICPARIQGKKALESHFSHSTFPCRTAEFLPAVFTPPRDGATDTSSATCYVGTLVAPRPPPSPRPAPAKPKPGRSAQKQRPAAS